MKKRNDKYVFLIRLYQVGLVGLCTYPCVFQSYFNYTPDFYTFQTVYYDFQTKVRK